MYRSFFLPRIAEKISSFQSPVKYFCSMASKNQLKQQILAGSGASTVRENGEHLLPVEAGAEGEGLPYGPEDWPNVGDKWKWKVGQRTNKSGFWFVDRYLYLPDSLQALYSTKRAFASRQSVKDFVVSKFPDADINAFFASFSWKIPSRADSQAKGGDYSYTVLPVNEYSEPSSATVGCKARNRKCRLRLQAKPNSPEAMECDICCSEPGFCRDCCCILCCKTVDWSSGDCSFFRCEAKVHESYVCGHVAHVNCALRSYMAGTVGGSIRLDVEYYCRRCDNRTNLIVYVTKLLETCEYLDSRHEIEKILNVCLCIIRGSEQTTAKNLVTQIKLILTKLKNGVNLGEVWKMEDNIPTTCTGETSWPLDVASNGNDLDFTTEDEIPICVTSDHGIEPLKLENEIDCVLLSLKRSQELEYRIAEQKLYGHKNFLLNLYEQLKLERTQLSKHTSLPTDSDSETLLSNMLDRADQIKREVIKLRQMMEISKGFGRTPNDILKEHFGLHVED